tara:strand:- start:55 stop:387 length:333 start_codon:yes stop_codon:yes gene_type:complete
MKRQEFESLIALLVESVKGYELTNNFDHHDALMEICANCDHSFVYGKAWDLVSYARFEDHDLFLDAEGARMENDHNTDNVRLDDYVLSCALHILRIATFKKWEELQSSDS